MFVGQGNYRFVAPTCKRFSLIYLRVHSNNKDNNSGRHEEDLSMTTSIKSAAESIAKCQVYLKEEFYFSEEGKLEKIVIAAALASNLSVLHHAISHPLGAMRIRANFDVCQAVASKGNLEALQMLRQYGSPWNSQTYLAANQNCHFEVAHWAKENGCPIPVNG